MRSKFSSYIVHGLKDAFVPFDGSFIISKLELGHLSVTWALTWSTMVEDPHRQMWSQIFFSGAINSDESVLVDSSVPFTKSGIFSLEFSLGSLVRGRFEFFFLKCLFFCSLSILIRFPLKMTQLFHRKSMIRPLGLHDLGHFLVTNFGLTGSVFDGLRLSIGQLVLQVPQSF